jgi:hypothetical protein
VDLAVVDREFPDAQGSDFHWVVVDVTVVLHAQGSGFRPAGAPVRVTLLDSEIAEFATDLRAFVDGRRDAAGLDHIEEELGIYVVRHGGAVMLHGYLATEGVTQSLHFAMPAKEDRLPTTVGEFEAITARFPPT